MDRGMVIFVGALLTFSSSWLGLVLYPFWQLQGEQPYTDPQGQADAYPRPLAGKALAGKRVYEANGCMYCHSQQLRSERFGRSPRALNLGREWTVDPGYRWRPSDAEWRKVVAEQGEAIRQRYGVAADLTTPEGRRQLLDFWLTTPEEEYQVVPTGEAD